jgi:hypothetical protein
MSVALDVPITPIAVKGFVEYLHLWVFLKPINVRIPPSVRRCA